MKEADRQEVLLRNRMEAAYSALAQAIRVATDAAKARNRARADYNRAMRALTEYRDRRPKDVQ